MGGILAEGGLPDSAAAKKLRMLGSSSAALQLGVPHSRSVIKPGSDYVFRHPCFDMCQNLLV